MFDNSPHWKFTGCTHSVVSLAKNHQRVVYLKLKESGQPFTYQHPIVLILKVLSRGNFIGYPGKLVLNGWHDPEHSSATGQFFRGSQAKGFKAGNDKINFPMCF